MLLRTYDPITGEVTGAIKDEQVTRYFLTETVALKWVVQGKWARSSLDEETIYTLSEPNDQMEGAEYDLQVICRRINNEVFAG